MSELSEQNLELREAERAVTFCRKAFDVSRLDFFRQATCFRLAAEGAPSRRGASQSFVSRA